MILEKEKAPSETLNPEEWLELLGQLEPDEIAQRLSEEGIKGNPKCGTQCPIAQGLMRRGILDPIVGADVWTTMTSVPLHNLPSSVITFIERFDTGFYYSSLARK
jgi:hypothetical protein